MKSVLLEYCTGCGESIRPHWMTCPVCQAPLHGALHGALPALDNPYLQPVRVEKEVRRDLLWGGIAMICLAVVGFAGFLMSLFRREWSLMSDDVWFGTGAIVFAAMVGGGLVGASKQKQGAAAKGVLKGLMYSLGAIFLVMAITVVIVVCLVLFLIVACMTSIDK